MARLADCDLVCDFAARLQTTLASRLAPNPYSHGERSQIMYNDERRPGTLLDYCSTSNLILSANVHRQSRAASSRWSSSTNFVHCAAPLAPLLPRARARAPNGICVIAKAALHSGRIPQREQLASATSFVGQLFMSAALLTTDPVTNSAIGRFNEEVISRSPTIARLNIVPCSPPPTDAHRQLHSRVHSTCCLCA